MDDKLKYILKHLRDTRRNEGICLQGWQAEILVEYINELERKAEEHESANHNREFMSES